MILNDLFKLTRVLYEVYGILAPDYSQESKMFLCTRIVVLEKTESVRAHRY